MLRNGFFPTIDSRNCKYKVNFMNKQNKKIDVSDALSQSESMELWLEKNWKKMLLLLIALSVVSVAAFAFYYYRSQSIREKEMALVDAENEVLAELLKDSSDTPASWQACLRLAQYRFEKKDFAGAGKMFEQVAESDTVPSEFRNRAKMSAASCLEMAGKNSDAAQYFMTIFKEPSTSALVRNEAGFNAGRLLAASADTKAQAKEVLQQVSESGKIAANNTSDTADMWQSRARVLLNSL